MTGNDQPRSTMNRYDQRLYRAWRAGVDAGYEYGIERDWPVGRELEGSYWRWRQQTEAQARGVRGRTQRGTNVR